MEGHDYIAEDVHLARNERKTFLVVVLTSVMMVVEVVAGYITGSMALLADGWHMASHATALTIAFIAYRLAKSHQFKLRFSFGTGKFIPLGGYTSAVLLGMIALVMCVESVRRLINPVSIDFNEAIFVAVIGLVVNLVSAMILGHEHDFEHDREHHVHDHNLRSAYFHVLADTLTSVLAIAALACGKLFGFVWLDPTIGIVGGIVILRWSYKLCHETAWELLDGHAKVVNREALKELVESGGGCKVLDMHVWRVAPKAIACELIVSSTRPRGAEYYRQLVRQRFDIMHLVVEETATTEPIAR